MLLPNWLEPLIRELAERSLPAYSELSEEEQYVPPAFVEADSS